MEAYITNANAKKLVYNLDMNSIDIDKEIFKINFKWFNQYEIKSLLAFRLLFEDPKLFFEKYEKRIPVDTKQYIYEGKSPSYHYYDECPRLLSQFNNYKIPEEIKDQGDDKIAEFRFWFIENIDSLETTPDYFYERLRMRFKLIQSPEVVNYKNSGVENFDNLNLDELENRIITLIEHANEFYLSSEKNRIILDHFGKSSFIYKEKKNPNSNNSGYSNKEIWDVLRKFDTEYKSPIMHLLREYYRVKYNPDIKFEGILLERLGYKLCAQCESQHLKDKVGNNNNLLETLRQQHEDLFKLMDMIFPK